MVVAVGPKPCAASALGLLGCLRVPMFHRFRLGFSGVWVVSGHLGARRARAVRDEFKVQGPLRQMVAHLLNPTTFLSVPTVWATVCTLVGASWVVLA